MGAVTLSNNTTVAGQLRTFSGGQGATPGAHFYNAGLTTGQNTGIFIGKATGNNTCATWGFVYDDTVAANNAFRLGVFGAPFAITGTALGNVTIGNQLISTSVSTGAVAGSTIASSNVSASNVSAVVVGGSNVTASNVFATSNVAAHTLSASNVTASNVTAITIGGSNVTASNVVCSGRVTANALTCSTSITCVASHTLGLSSAFQVSNLPGINQNFTTQYEIEGLIKLRSSNSLYNAISVLSNDVQTAYVRTNGLASFCNVLSFVASGSNYSASNVTAITVGGSNVTASNVSAVVVGGSNVTASNVFATSNVAAHTLSASNVSASNVSAVVVSVPGVLTGSFLSGLTAAIPAQNGFTPNAVAQLGGVQGTRTALCTFLGANTNQNHIEFINLNGLVGSITTSGSATTFNTASDYRIKDNVAPLSNATTQVDQLRPVTFNFKADPTVRVPGFIAHEVAAVAPEVVTGDKDGLGENGEIKLQTMDYGRLTPLLTAAIQEVMAEVQRIKVHVGMIYS
jgi:hypothetical protein